MPSPPESVAATSARCLAACLGAEHEFVELANQLHMLRIGGRLSADQLREVEMRVVEVLAVRLLPRLPGAEDTIVATSNARRTK